MKRSVIWAGGVAVAIAGLVFAAAGCSGGSGSNTLLVAATASPTPTPTPTPVPAVASVTALASSTTGPIHVSWSLPATISTGDVVQFHIFRDGQIVGVAGQDTSSFTEPTTNGVTITYFTVGTTLTQLSTTVPTFTYNAGHIYTVTALHFDLATSTYAETSLGTSQSVSILQ